VTAKNFPLRIGAVILMAGVMTGCRPHQAGMAPGSSGEQSTRNNGYSLLHQVLDEEKDVSMLRFIKLEDSDVKNLVNRIAATSETGSKLLEDLASHDPSIVLNDTGLPPGEMSARAAIAATERDELLSQTGNEFELTLLLSQTDALNYAWHLAKVTGDNEPQPDRARALASVSHDMQDLYQETFALLLSKTRSSAKR
jgi:hypothetical protein